MARIRSARSVLALTVLLASAILGGGAGAVLGVCGPFTDVSDATFCPFVLEIFTLGITTGTTPTTYDPTGNVSRIQMAAFLSRSVDGVLKRGNRRAAMNQFWTTQNATVLGMTTVGSGPRHAQFDGADVWVTNRTDGSVSRVRTSDARLLETWTGAVLAEGIVVAMNRVLVTGKTSPGDLTMLDPSKPAGAVTIVASNLGNGSAGIAFDGARVWTANNTAPGSVSIVTPQASIPWTVTTLSIASGSPRPIGILYDGANIWVTDNNLGTISRLNSSGAVLQTVTVGTNPLVPVFDGTNIWVPNGASDSVTVLRASNGSVLQTLTGNGLSTPLEASFDGERILVTNFGDAVSLWKAADLTTLGSFPTGTFSGPLGVCSDGARFWVVLNSTGMLARF